MTKEKIFSIVAVVVVLIGVAGLGFWGYKNKPAAEVKEEVTVAKVNGTPITKSTYDSQLAQVIATLKTQGVNTEGEAELAQIKTQVLNDLIGNELLIQGYTKAGIVITDAQIEEQFQLLVKQAGDLDKLKAQLVAANLTEEQFRANIGRQMAIQTYLLQNIDISTAVATDAEAQKFYNDNVKTQANAPKFADVKDQIKQQIVANKQQVLIATFIASLREKAQVETTI